MRNGSISKVVDVGTANLGLVNDVEMELKEVSHIIDLKRNLISLGTLDAVGYTCKIGKGNS